MALFASGLVRVVASAALAWPMLGCQLFESSPTEPAQPQPLPPGEPVILVDYGFEPGDDDTGFVMTLQESSLYPTPPATLTPETTIVHAGRNALRCFTGKGDRGVGNGAKASVGKQVPPLAPGTLVRLAAWFYLPDNLANGDPAQHARRFLLDLEDNTHDGDGMQVYVNPDGYLRTNNSELEPYRVGSGSNALSATPVPLAQWFRLEWWVYIHAGAEGYMRLYVNGALAATGNGPTIPARWTAYNWIEWGLTVNRKETETALYVDDVYGQIEAEAPADAPIN